MVRSSAGLAVQAPLFEKQDIAAVLRRLEPLRPLVAGLDAAGDRRLPEMRFPESVLLLVGTEGQGLGGDLMEAAAVTLSIPMSPEVESLNLATAAAVACYEFARQRSGSGPSRRLCLLAVGGFDRGQLFVGERQVDGERSHFGCQVGDFVLVDFLLLVDLAQQHGQQGADVMQGGFRIGKVEAGFDHRVESRFERLPADLDELFGLVVVVFRRLAVFHSHSVGVDEIFSKTPFL